MAVGHLLVAILGLAGVFLLGLAVVAWRSRSKPGARWFAGMAVCGAVWVLADGIGLGFVAPGLLRLYFGNVVAVASIAAAVCWVAFVVSYTGRSHWLTGPRLIALAALPAATIGVLLLDPTSALIQPTWSFESLAGLTLLSIEGGPLLLLVEAYLFVLIGGMFVLMLRTMRTESEAFRGQLWSLIGGSLAILVGVAVDILDLVRLDVVVTDLSVVIAITTFAVALYRQQLLALVPAISHLGAGAAIADLDDGVVIVDGDGTIVRCNPAAGRYLGVDGERVVDTAISTHLPSVPLEEGEWTVSRRGRTYRVTASAITGRGDRTVGYTVLLRDVTPLELREQRLAVLNRLLRHNLRNDVDAIEKHASVIAARTEGQVAESAETIDRLALRLADLGDKARLAEDALDVDRSRAVAVELESVLGDIRTSLLERDTAATIEIDVPEGVSVRSHARPIRIALRNVLENAIQHTGPDPRVAVTVTPTDSGVEITVADEGPGIPGSEVAVLEAGAESQLDHGSGIGLWLVHWAVAALDGDVDIGTSETGSRVTIRLPDLDGRRGDPSGSPRIE